MALKTITTDFLTWIDVDQPTAHDIETLRSLVTIHPHAFKEFSIPTSRARVTQYPNGIFLALHIPLYNKDEHATYQAEFDAIITETHIITGHVDAIYQLDAFFEKFQQNKELQTDDIGKGPAYLLHAILTILIDTCFPRVEHIAKKIDAVEVGVFHNHEDHMVREISNVKRDIINFRRAIMPQRAIIESLMRKDHRFIPRELHPYLYDLVDANTHLWHMLESHKEAIESLEDTNDTLLSHKINEKMRIITIFSAIILIPTLYVSTLGISADIPLHDHPHSFWIHVSIMFVIGVLTMLFFKWRRWI